MGAGFIRDAENEAEPWSLGEIAPHVAMIEIKCDRCDKYGRLKSSTLLEQYGSDILMPDLAMALARDCPNRDASIYERCSPYFLNASNVTPSANVKDG